MTYEEWRKNYKFWLKEAWIYNQWRERALRGLLSNLAPRIDAISRQMYNGCGFHYSKIQSLGKVLPYLAINWHPSVSHLDKITDQDLSNITTKVIVEDLFKQVFEAEKSAAEWKKQQAETSWIRSKYSRQVIREKKEVKDNDNL